MRKEKTMKYVVGKIGSMLGGEYRTRYTNSKCIEADSEEEAVRIYNKHEALSNSMRTLGPSYAKCIGFLDEKNRLCITEYHVKYLSGKNLRPLKTGTHNYLVSRLLDEPKKLSEYSYYVPEFIQAVCPEDALEIYKNLYPSTQFPAYILGYLDENNTFIVPNILDYIA